MENKKYLKLYLFLFVLFGTIAELMILIAATYIAINFYKTGIIGLITSIVAIAIVAIGVLTRFLSECIKEYLFRSSKK